MCWNFAKLMRCEFVQVLFQNDSLATLLARVVGILGPIDPELLAKGRDTHKFFTKNHTLYERNQVRVELNTKNSHEFGYWPVNNLGLNVYFILGRCLLMLNCFH